MYNPTCAYQFTIYKVLWNDEGACTLLKFMHNGGWMTSFNGGLLSRWCGDKWDTNSYIHV